MAVKSGMAQQAYDDGYRDGSKAARLEKLERNRRVVHQIAAASRANGITQGAVIWHEALAKIIELTR